LQRLKGNKETITRALARLPRTLDETYERIFAQVPNEARLFVRHALKWIYAHNALWGSNISPLNLIQAVQKSTAGLDSSGYDYDYNEEFLREFCGCLISVSLQDRPGDWQSFPPTPAVSFAHYTVLEFLDSTRIRNGPASWFAADKDAAKLEFAKMVILETLDTRWNETWPTAEVNHDDKDIADAVEKDFSLYSVASSALAVHNWGPSLALDPALYRPTFALFDTTREHFEAYKNTIRSVESATNFFDNRSLQPAFWDLAWKQQQQPTSNDLRTLVHLLIEDESCELGRKFLQSLPSGTWLQSTLDFDASTLHGMQLDWDRFRGTILEFSAFTARKYPQRMGLFLDFFTEDFDATRALLSTIGWHFHEDEFGCTEGCFLQRLLHLGADPDARGYRICPLQMATGAWDLEGVRVLLEAGADPSCAGDQKSPEREVDTTPALFNGVLGRSPLNIAQTMGCVFDGNQLYERRPARPKIVALLHKYGARDFIMKTSTTAGT